MTFANRTELTMLGLEPENYSALQSTEPKKCFYSPESEQKPSATSALKVSGYAPAALSVTRLES